MSKVANPKDVKTSINITEKNNEALKIYMDRYQITNRSTAINTIIAQAMKKKWLS